jgi:hypothetical protein
MTEREKVVHKMSQDAADFIEQEIAAAREESYYAGVEDALSLVWQDVEGKQYQTRVRRLVGFLKKEFKRERAWERIGDKVVMSHPWGTS